MTPQPEFARAPAQADTPLTVQPWLASHDVQFYESDDFLVSTVADYLATGVRLGQPIVVIATLAHQAGYRKALRARGINPGELIDGRDAVWLDASTALSSFMEGGRVNPELFAITVGSVLESLRRNRRYVMIRAHGEMVDLLWREGKGEAALALEDLWNGLASQYAFSLLCTYSRQTLGRVSQMDGIDRICATHTRVLSTDTADAGYIRK